MNPEQLSRVKRARVIALALAERLDAEDFGHGLDTQEAREIVSLLDAVLDREPVIPHDGHVRRPGGGTVYTLDELGKRSVE